MSMKKHQEVPVIGLPGCKVYSIRQRPRSFPKNDIDVESWPVVFYNIEKESPLCNITVTGDTLDDAVNAMKEALDTAEKLHIDTFNGVPGSGLGKGKHNLPDLNGYNINVSYRVDVSVGPWKKKSKGEHNNNCGRHQVNQEMRRIVIGVTISREWTGGK